MHKKCYWQEADFMMIPIIITSSRFVDMDFTHIYNHEQLALLMPMPSASSDNVEAVWAPLQPPVFIQKKQNNTKTMLTEKVFCSF